MFSIFSTSYAYYGEFVSRDDFAELYSNNMVINLSLKYDKRSEDQSSVYFSGSGKISGVLVYHYYKIFGEKFHNGDKNIIGGFAVYVELTINNLQIVNELGYVAQFDSSYIIPTGDVKKWYLDAAKTGNTLCLTTDDDYSNLRKTLGGKILFKVYKDSINNDSGMDSEKDYLIEMPSKGSDIKWRSVVFLKAGDSTWENGVFGYIH